MLQILVTIIVLVFIIENGIVSIPAGEPGVLFLHKIVSKSNAVI